jgi:hypothetical protein
MTAGSPVTQSRHVLVLGRARRAVIEAARRACVQCVRRILPASCLLQSNLRAAPVFPPQRALACSRRVRILVPADCESPTATV